MNSLYAACLSRIGIDHTTAAIIHNVSIDTVRSWSSGRNETPQYAFDQLRLIEKNIIIKAGGLRVESISDLKIDTCIKGKSWTDVMAKSHFILSTNKPIYTKYRKKK